MVTKVLFLDRDGICNLPIIKNGKPFSPRYVNQLIFHPDIKCVVEAAKNKNYKIFIVTNQPDVARKSMTLNVANEINKLVLEHSGADDLFACYHDDSDNCDCRKPKTGLFSAALQLHQITQSESIMIGDRHSDMLAGSSFGCTTIFIDYKYSEPKVSFPDYRFDSLIETIALIK